jgi:hypothetical protein
MMRYTGRGFLMFQRAIMSHCRGQHCLVPKHPGATQPVDTWPGLLCFLKKSRTLLHLLIGDSNEGVGKQLMNGALET